MKDSRQPRIILSDRFWRYLSKCYNFGTTVLGLSPLNDNGLRPYSFRRRVSCKSRTCNPAFQEALYIRLNRFHIFFSNRVPLKKMCSLLDSYCSEVNLLFDGLGSRLCAFGIILLCVCGSIRREPLLLFPFAYQKVYTGRGPFDIRTCTHSGVFGNQQVIRLFFVS